MAYATFAQYTAVYSVPGVAQGATETFLERASTRLNEALGAYYTTPFSNNNLSARELSIDMARWMLQLRTSKQDDSQELGKEIDKRLDELRKGTSFMVTTSGEVAATPANASNVAWSTAIDWKNTFDERDPVEQRVDPDLVTELWDRDTA